MVGRFGYDFDPDHAGKPIANLYCSSYIITRKVREWFLADEQKNFVGGTLWKAFTGRPNTRPTPAFYRLRREPIKRWSDIKSAKPLPPKM